MTKAALDCMARRGYDAASQCRSLATSAVHPSNPKPTPQQQQQNNIKQYEQQQPRAYSRWHVQKKMCMNEWWWFVCWSWAPTIRTKTAWWLKQVSHPCIYIMYRSGPSKNNCPIQSLSSFCRSLGCGMWRTERRLCEFLPPFLLSGIAAGFRIRPSMRTQHWHHESCHCELWTSPVALEHPMIRCTSCHLLSQSPRNVVIFAMVNRMFATNL